MSTYQLIALGVPRVVGPDGDVALPLGKPLALLCFVMFEEHEVTRDDMARILWPNATEERARASLRQALWVLRKELGPDIFIEEEAGLHVDRTILGTDLDTFDGWLARGDLERAWETWRGGFLRDLTTPDAPDWQAWADRLRTEWELRFGEALEAYALAHSGEEQLVWLRRALEVRPYREQVHHRIIRTLLDLRRTDDAREALNRYRAVMDEPDLEELRALEGRLRLLVQEGFEVPGTRLEPEFVGRSEAFSALSRVWRSALSGRPRTVGIIGPSGIGKTRLAGEFLRHAVVEGASVAEARGIYGEGNLDYGVVGSLVRDLLTLPGAAGISAASSATLRSLVPSASGAAPLHAMPAGAGLADAVSDLLAAVAHEGPLVVLIEDVHWADAPSRTVLLRAMRAVAGEHVLMLWTCRTEDEDGAGLRQLRSAEEHEHATVIELDPLDVGEIAEMLALLLQGASEAVVDRLSLSLHAVTGGNPLHLVEVLESLRADGTLSYTRGVGWRLDEDRLPETLDLPGSVRQALERRLEGLSADATLLAAHVAGHRDAVVPGAALEALDIGNPRATSALSELLERNILRWTRDGGLEIAHDVVRSAVRSLEDEPAAAGPRWLVPVAAVGVVAAAVFAATVLLSPTEVPDPEGMEGTIFVEIGPKLVQLEFEDQGAGPLLRRVDSVTLSPGFAHSGTPGRDPNGRWLFPVSGNAELDREPDAFLMVEDSLRPLWQTAGDDNTHAIAPNGRYALLSSEHPDTSWFRMQAVRIDLETSDTAVVGMGWGTWRADGRFLLFPHPTMSVAFPDGTVHAELGAGHGEVTQAEWCGLTDDVVFSALPPARGPTPMRWNTRTGEVTALSLSRRAATLIGCTPDGRRVLYLSREAGRGSLVLEEPGGVAQVVGVWDGAEEVSWVQSGAGAPTGVEIEDPPGTMARGESRTLAPRILGLTRPARERLDWVSSDPLIASVDSGGTVTANGTGTATIRAVLDGWLEDSVQIRVDPGPDSRVSLLQDPFTSLDADRWISYGFPEAGLIESEDGQVVVSMNGDGSGSDGLVTRESFSIREGATLEVDFRLELDRPDKQAFGACLYDGDLGAAPRDRTSWSSRDDLCFAWPAAELDAFDPGRARFDSHSVPMGQISVEGVIRPGEWNRVAIQVRPDGEAHLFVNGEVVARLVEPLPLAPDQRWHVLIQGRAYETTLLVRNLSLWGEARYPVVGEAENPAGR